MARPSIYDLAETAFGGVVALREHFRCVPEIIQFSNDLSYNLTIRPLREPNSVLGEASVDCPPGYMASATATRRPIE